MRTFLLTIALVLAPYSLAAAQTTVQVANAELSVPFGTASGKIVLAGEYLIFIDDEKPDASFAITRKDIQKISTEGDVITIETRQPIRDRSGERSRFSVRLTAGNLALAEWSGVALPASPSSVTTGKAEILTYQTRHKHLLGLGSCSGRLIITESRISYETSDKAEDARQWELRDIKEFKQEGPYILEVEPFIGNKYRFELEGKGMDIQDYKAVVARITTARVGR
jgi:hypothetical protein